MLQLVACQARCVKLAELRVGERMSSKVCQAGGAARRRRGRLLTPGSSGCVCVCVCVRARQAFHVLNV